MSASVRRNLGDFFSALAAVAPASSNIYQGLANADGWSCSIIRNPNGINSAGVAAPRGVVFDKVFWTLQANSSVVTDANPNGDVVVLYHGVGTRSWADVQQFLNTLP